MDKMPVFTWQAPNIRPLVGAEWIKRYRFLDGAWEPNISAPDGGSGQPIRGKPWGATHEYSLPKNVGDAFYKTLRKLGYTKGPRGDYQ